MQSRFKYPRTHHLPWSPGATDDDIRNKKADAFNGLDVIVTEKMDGENTTLYSDFMHARSIDSRYHASRDWLKGLHAQISHDIPSGWRVCGENLYAQHSVVYQNLESYFYGFSIWNDENICLSWGETLEWFEAIGVAPVPVIFEGRWDEEKIKSIVVDTGRVEGYVVRLASSFSFEDFSKSVAKWVRTDHVTSETHWMNQELRPNGLK